MRTRRLVTAATLAAAASAAPTVEYIARAQGIAASQVTLVGPIGACFTSCQLPLGFVQFEDLTPGPYWVSRINSPTFLTSVAACMSTHCSPTEIEEGWERLGLFRDFGAPGTPVPPLDEVLVRMGDVHQVPIIDVFDHMGETFNYTILSSDSNYKDAIRTQSSWNDQFWLHSAFGVWMYLLVILMALIGVANRVLAVLASRAAAQGLPPAKPLFSSLYTWYRRVISTPALMGYRHVQAWGMLSIPTRLQSIMIFAYVAVNIVFSSIKIEPFHNSMYFYGHPEVQLARMIADRTGIMSFYNMVIMWLFAGRNDVLIWISGWSFQSLNLFHRWIARIAVVQAIVHSLAYGWLKWNDFAEMMRENYWKTGVYATIVMSLIWLPLSIRPLRERAYETFLWLHIVLSMALLYYLWEHVKRFNFGPMVVLCGGIWAFDRLFRLVRIAILSFRSVFGRNATGVLTAVNPGLVRLSVTTSVPISPNPGDYYFLYSASNPLQNHPFTLASWETLDQKTVLHFLVAPMAGWTRTLARHVSAPPPAAYDETEPLLATSDNGASMRILLEGPYGHACPVEDYDHILLLAGGSGIAAVLPYVQRLAASGRKHRATLIWTSRTAEYAADVLRHELAEHKSAGLASIEIALTKESPEVARTKLASMGVASYDPDASTGSPASSRLFNPAHTHPAALSTGSTALTVSSKQALQFDASRIHPASTAPLGVHPRAGLPLKLSAGRPDLRDVLDDALADLGKDERLAVLGCGPGAMMDDLRREVAASYGGWMGQITGDRLEYFEESFTW